MVFQFIPPKIGAIAFTILIISMEILCIKTNGKGQFWKSLKSAALPSITELHRLAPILPSPKTADPSLTMRPYDF